MTFGARLRRWALFAARAFLLVLAAVLALSCALMFTTPGRALVLGLASRFVNDGIPGRVVVTELSRFDPWAVEVRGVEVRDPKGAVVVRLGRLRVGLRAADLVRGRVVLPSVVLQDGTVDLRDVGRKDRGLLAAFVVDEPEGARAEPGPPPYVRVDEIVVDRLSVRAPPLPRVGAIDVRSLQLRAHFVLDGSPRARLDRLSARVEREGNTLGEISKLEGELAASGQPSRAMLEARLLGIRLGARVESVLPGTAGWPAREGAFRLDIENVTASALSKLLRDETLATSFRGPISVHAKANGPVEALPLDVSIATAGGNVRFESKISDLEAAEILLTTSALDPSKIVSEVPSRKLSLRWRVRAAPRGSGTAVSLETEETRVDDVTLPTAKVRALVSSNQVRDLDVLLSDEQSHVRAEGELGFDGSADLDVDVDVRAASLRTLARLFGRAPPTAEGRIHGTLAVRYRASGSATVKGDLRAQNVDLPGFSVEEMKARVDLTGTAPFAAGEIELAAKNLRAAAERVPELSVSVKGGPSRYRLSLQARLATARAFLDATVEPTEEDVNVRGRGHGSFRGKEWQVRIEPTRVGYEGTLDTHGIALSAAGQTARVVGRFTRSGADLRVDAERIDLAEVSKLVAPDLRLGGVFSLRGRVRGTFQRPIASVELTLDDFRTTKGPGLDVEARGELNVPSGELRLEATAGSHVRTKGISKRDFMMAVEGTSRFRASGDWLEALERPDHEFDLAIRVDRLESTFVQEWLPETVLPVSGSLAGQIRAAGSLGSPVVQTRMGAQLLVPGADESVAWVHELDYAEGRIRTRLNARDGRGELVDLNGTLNLNGNRSLFQLAEILPRVLDQGAWQARVDLPERHLQHIPLIQTIPNLPNARLRALLDVKHEPHQEPEGRLSASLMPAAGGTLPGACGGVDVGLEAIAELEGGNLHAELVGRARREELLRLAVDGAVRLAPALAGEDAKLGALTARLRSEDLNLENVPFLCNRVQGIVTADATIVDPLGSSPRAALRMQVRDLDLGSEKGVLVGVRAEATRERATADLSIEAEHASSHRSRIRAEVPILWKDASFDISKDSRIRATARLRHLPVSPFVPPDAQVSYASGTVSGQVRLDGTLNQPHVAGWVDLEDIAFTATDFAQPLRQIEGRVRFTDTHVVVERLSARDKEGEVSASGRLTFDDANHLSAKLKIRAKDFPIRQQGQVVATTNLRADVNTTVGPDETDIAIRLHDVDTWLEGGEVRRGIALDAHPDVVVDGVPPSRGSPDRESQPLAPPAERTPSRSSHERPHLTELTLDATERFWVKRDDFAVKLSAHLRTRIQGEDVRVKGAVDVDRGYLQLLGRSFDIERGSKIEFIGSPKPDPVLAITATHTNRRSGDLIKVVISGRASAPELTFSINDREATAGDALLAIYGSEKSNSDPDDADAQAKRFVGGLTAGLLATSARRELGAAAPILMVDPGEEAGEGRVRAGFELDSLVPRWLRGLVTGVYLEGIVARESEGTAQGAQTQGGALLELYFPKGYFTSGQYGPGAIWSIDLGWQL